MATAHVQTKDNQTASGTSTAVSLTGVTAGNHFFAFTAIGAASGMLSSDPLVPTSSPSATWSNANAATTNTGATDMAWRSDYSENIASGSWTVTIRSNTTHEVTGVVSESSGVATSGSIGAVNQANSGATAVTTQQPGSITPAAGSIVYTAICDAGGGTAADTINLSYTVHSDSTAWNGANQRAGDASLDNVAGSATNPTWTLVSAHAAAVIAEFKASAGGGLPSGQEIGVGTGDSASIVAMQR